MSTKEKRPLVEGVPNEAKALWLEEIVRETEHYFQGEIQQDQRASWLLATNSVLVAVVGGLELPLLNKKNAFLEISLIISLIFFAISSGISIITIIPFRGTRLWTDFLGNHYRRNKSKSIEELIKERFRHDNNWSKKEYELRLMYHFRSHYLRFNHKAYGVLWSALFLMIGLILLLIVGIRILI